MLARPFPAPTLTPGGRWAALTVAVAAAVRVLAQQPATPPQTPQFRAGVDLVPVYVSVLDQYGDVVRDLTRDEFEVLDNGRRQAIAAFTSGLQPINVVLMLDTSSSMTLNVDLEKAAAEQFVIRLLPGDRARVGSFNDRVTITPTFTDDRDALLRAIRTGVEFGNPTLLWDALDASMSAVAGEAGRRMTVVLTDGGDTISRKTWKDVTLRARVEGLSIYVVWLRGSFRVEQDRPTGNVPPLELLRDVARSTGGGVFPVRQSQDVGPTLAAIAEELHYQYVLSFKPQDLNGRMHDLAVRVRRAGLTIRARKAYLASPTAIGGRP